MLCLSPLLDVLLAFGKASKGTVAPTEPPQYPKSTAPLHTETKESTIQSNANYLAESQNANPKKVRKIHFFYI